MTDATGDIDFLVESALDLARHGAESGIGEIHKRLLMLAGEDDGISDREEGVLTQDPEHAGDPARLIDAAAHEAVRDALNVRFSASEVLGKRVEHFHVIGEEGGIQTQILRAGTLIARTDPLDGTTNAVNTLSGFACVVSIDFLKNSQGPIRHLAGAIMGGDFDLSWTNRSPRAASNPMKYQRLEGQVFVRSNRLGMGWQRLNVEEDRRSTSVASVAASLKRFTAFERVRQQVFSHGGIVYHLAGNPLWAGLLMGQVGFVVETQKVTLHDSVFLIPHSLLGGIVEREDGSPLHYLEVYEQNASRFDPREKVIPPYVAFCGGVDRNALTRLTNNSFATAASIPVNEVVSPVKNQGVRSVELPKSIF
ncbi:MAG: hypothetical protein V9G15_00005 [Dermatophilaceae bacterium]